MGLAEEIFERYDGFRNREECFAVRECTIPRNIGDPECWVTDTTPDARLEREWEKVQANAPIPLPEDYREIFVVFGDGAIEDHREKYIFHMVCLWLWEDMEDFIDTMGLSEDMPKMVPFGDDCGDMVYLYGEGKDGLGVYMCDKGCCFGEEPTKIADSFTQLVTDEETQRIARNLYSFGFDRGGDGR